MNNKKQTKKPRNTIESDIKSNVSITNIDSFDEFEISDLLKEILKLDHFLVPTPIQSSTIPLLLEGDDCVGQAQTGSGKTLAYSIPLIQQIINEIKDGTDKKGPQAIILCPTRELCMQITGVINKIIKRLDGVLCASIYGGQSYEIQFKALKLDPKIIVATPGRVIDHLKRKTISLKTISFLVLDEADEMLKMGFQEDLEFIFSETPEEKQIALFSATMPQFIKNVINTLLKNPKIVKIKAPALTVETIKQSHLIVKKQDKKILLERIIDFYQAKSIMIFANTKKDCDEIFEFLNKKNYRVSQIHGDLKQNQRDQVMQQFRKQLINILVCSDVAARGVDINDIGLVINFELPFDNEIYVHRIGRTGRAGKEGLAISLVSPRETNKLQMIEKYIKAKIIKAEIPSNEEIDQVIINKDYTKVYEAVANYDVHEKEQLLLADLLQSGFNLEQIALALLNKQSTKLKQYPQLSNPKERTFESRDNRTSDRKLRNSSSEQKVSKNLKFEKKKDQYLFEVNVGAANGFKAVHIIDFLDENFDIFRRHVGDIKVLPNKTQFYLNKIAISRIDKKTTFVFRGSKIKVSSSTN